MLQEQGIVEYLTVFLLDPASVGSARKIFRLFIAMNGIVLMQLVSSSSKPFSCSVEGLTSSLV